MTWFRPNWSRRRLTGHVAWFGGWLAVTVGAMLVHPSPHGHGSHQQLGLPACPSVVLFGRPCPGCGLTTSFAALVRGDLATAWAAHPFGPLLYVAWTLTAWACLYGFLRRQRFETETRGWTLAIAGLTLAFFVYGVARFATKRATLNGEPSVFALTATPPPGP